MSLEKADLIIHPVRLRIFMSLAAGPQTTQEIAGRLPDVPLSSLYRHLKLLSAGGLIEVVEARIVQGIQEKVYGLAQAPHLDQDDIAHFSPDDYLRHFTTFIVALLQGFVDYLAATSAPDLARDYAGFTEAPLWGTAEEIEAGLRALNEVIGPLISQGPGPGRRQYKLATIIHPIFD
jgi:DNA-binding transcriptional ArsR family regulator